MTEHEHSNPHDKYVVAGLPVDSKTKNAVLHLPREVSKECCLFIYHKGTITGVVNGRRRKTFETCSGMEILCELKFSHNKKKVVGKVNLCVSQKYGFRP